MQFAKKFTLFWISSWLDLNFLYRLGLHVYWLICVLVCWHRGWLKWLRRYARTWFFVFWDIFCNIFCPYQLFLSSSSLLYYQNLVLIWSVLIVFKFHALVHAYDQHICSDILLLIFLYEILCSAILVNVSVIDYWTIFF